MRSDIKLYLSWFFLLSLSLFQLDCGGSYSPTAGATPVGTTLSCNFASSDLCLDYGSGYTAVIAQAACTSGGVFSTSSNCTSTNRVGTCLTVTAGLTLTQSYYSPTYTSGAGGTASTACVDQGGTFSSS